MEPNPVPSFLYILRKTKTKPHMKKIFLLIGSLCLISWNVNAQAWKSKEVEVADILEFMERDGKYIQKYDLSAITDTTLQLAVRLQEHFGRDSVKTHVNQLFGPVRLIYPWGDTVWAKEVMLMVGPKSDSTALFTLSLKDRSSISRLVKYRKMAPYFTAYATYMTRPFEVAALKEGEYTPISLYGSFWFDKEIYEKHGQIIHRFCGSNEVDVALEDEMFDLSPHYFIVSIGLFKSE